MNVQYVYHYLANSFLHSSNKRHSLRMHVVIRFSICIYLSISSIYPSFLYTILPFLSFLPHQIPPSWMLNNASSKKMGLPWSSTSTSSSSSVAKKKAVTKQKTSNRGENKEAGSGSKSHSHHHSSHKHSSSSVSKSKSAGQPILEVLNISIFFPIIFQLLLLNDAFYYFFVFYNVLLTSLVLTV